jgi:hypothetical protein
MACPTSYEAVCHFGKLALRFSQRRGCTHKHNALVAGKNGPKLPSPKDRRIRHAGHLGEEGMCETCNRSQLFMGIASFASLLQQATFRAMMTQMPNSSESRSWRGACSVTVVSANIPFVSQIYRTQWLSNVERWLCLHRGVVDGMALCRMSIHTQTRRAVRQEGNSASSI